MWIMGVLLLFSMRWRLVALAGWQTRATTPELTRNDSTPTEKGKELLVKNIIHRVFLCAKIAYRLLTIG